MSEFVRRPKNKAFFIVRQFEGDFALGDQIASVLADAPFLPLRQIAKRVMISKSTVYRHLTSGMGWRLKRLRWVPHRLTDVEKVTRFQKTQELWAVLGSVQHHGWQYLVTLDEFWFYWDIDWEQQWLPADHEPGTQRR
jgi:hypothetical protein